MQLLKLVADQIVVGEPLPWDVLDADGTLLLKRGLIISKDSQRDALVARGVFADEGEVRAHEARLRGEGDAPPRPLSLFGVWEKSLWQWHALTQTPLSHPSFDADLHAQAQALMAQIDKDPDIALYLSVRQDQRRYILYGWLHALHTATLSRLAGQRLGWPEARTLTLVKAALTMNLSTMELQGKMAAQESPPSATQRKLLDGHAALSVEILRKRSVTDPELLETVLHHHGLQTGTAQPELAHALNLIDIFIAKISPRLHRPALPIQLAAKQMFQDDRGGPTAMAIIKEFGIYPPGECVRLHSGEVALVVRRGKQANTPLAASLTDRKGNPVTQTELRDCALPEYGIVAVEPASQMVMRVPPERLYGVVPA
jgi:hypothetical protein